MKLVPALFVFVLNAGVAAARDHGAHSAWRRWRSRHRPQGYSSGHEEQKRYQIYKENRELVRQHNAQGLSYQLKLNDFADMTWEEFKSSRLGASQNCSATRNNRGKGAEERFRLMAAAVPSSIDWRDKQAVSIVKNQGHCGSCWTFSTTGCLESHYFLKYQEMKLFSEQQLVDCAQAFDNHGCNGGLPSHAFEYVHYLGGIESEDDYPYLGVNSKCHFNISKVQTSVAGQYNITFQDEKELEAAIGTVGPVSVAFQVAADFRFYDKGVYDSRVCRSGPEDVNHAVLAVGYDNDPEDGSLEHYIVKNSWGPEWGLDGYFLMRKGENMCGVADCASYPIIA